MNVRARIATEARASAAGILAPLPIALFIARVALETTGRPWPGGIVVAVGMAAALAGCLLAWWWVRRGGPRARPRARPYKVPWLLLIYVCWPSRQPVAAASVVLVAGLTYLLSLALERAPGTRGSDFSRSPTLPRWAEWASDGGVFVIALAVYVATLSPDVLPADSGEFQLAAARWGVAHPPGFPLYTLVGALFVRLVPLSTPAYRLNLLSAILAAGTLLLVARATRTWGGFAPAASAGSLGMTPPSGTTTPLALAGGVAAALALGTATTFWAQATVANIRTPSIFCAALALCQLARFTSATHRAAGIGGAAARKEADRALLWLGVALGLGLGHHPSLVFAGVFYVLYVLLADPRLSLQPRRWWRLLVALPVGLLPFIYLPVRGAAGAPLAPAGLDTLSGFLHHAGAQGFAGDMFAYANAADLPHRLALLPTLWPFQFNRGLLAAAAAGLLLLAWRNWRLFVLLAGSLAVHTFVTMTYRAPQTVEYLMPAAYPPVAVAVGLLPALVGVIARGARRARGAGLEAIPAVHGGTSQTSDVWEGCTLAAFLSALVLCAGLLNGWAHLPSFIELARDRSTRQTVAPLLEQAPPNALLLTDWHWATPLWYLQQVEGLRPDVEVRYVYNVAGEEYRETWRQRVEAVEPGRPLILTHSYEFSGFTGEPWWAGFRLHPSPITEPTAPLTELEVTFGRSVRLLGYHLSASSLQPGQTVECTLAWQALEALEQPHSFTLRLSGAAGELVAQADQALSSNATPGEVRFERLVLPLYPSLAPGLYHVTLGAYISGEGGFEDLAADVNGAAPMARAVLTALELEAPRRSPYTLHPRSIPFAAGPTLVGVDYDRSLSNTLRVYLRWRGPIPAGCQALLTAGGAGAGSAALPAIPAGAYQTAVVDLPGASTRPRLALTCGVGAESEPAAAAGPWGWALRRVRLPLARHDARFVPLGEGIAVVGARARTATPGETARVDVTLVALRPLVDDAATSVRLMDADGRWLARHDMQPALGAIPTLKWIRGSRVVDRHLLPVPFDYTGPTVQAALVAYERFRQTEWVALDERFGQVPLGVWPQP